MNTKQNISLCASAFQIAFSLTLISLSAVLLTFAAAPKVNQIQQKTPSAGIDLRTANRHAVASESALQDAKLPEMESMCLTQLDS
jgi:hypothetical protein